RTSVDTLALAQRLLTQGARAEPEQPTTELPALRSDPLARLAEGTAHLSEEERSCLADAVEHGTPVRIVYTDRQGATTVRVIEPTELHGKLGEAWCRLRKDDRAFHLERINAVLPI